MYEVVNLESIDFSTINIAANSASSDNNNTPATVASCDLFDDADLSHVSNSTSQIVWLSHNSLLNCLFILTNQNQLILYDCNSKNVLKKVNLNATDASKNYSYVRIFNIQDKCIVASDRTICSRLAHDGLFLLDTVFQTSFNSITSKQFPGYQISNKTRFTLELNLFDAKALLQALKLLETENISINGLEEIIFSISKQVNELATSSPLDQWLTVKISETYANLLTILNHSLEETKRINLQSIAIPILSMLLDRLYRLDTSLIESQLQSSRFANFDKRYMCSESTRRATFSHWPHMDYKWVLPDALAQAGFFHQPSSHGDDRTICFACDLCLVAWEQQDQPWSEHERHSPQCLFVRGEVTENVPLALTASNQCASQIFKINEVSETIVCTSELSSERYFAVSNSTGHIVVYDSKDLLKEMMHVQLINESTYNKEHPLRINTLCFYYRNHKHVLYGSFTINKEVFVFSFNIFDIYRSYNSKSNKKPGKSQKSSSSSKKSSSQGISMAAQNSNIPLPTKFTTTVSTTTNAPQMPETVTINMPKTVTLSDSKPVVVSTQNQDTESTNNNNEFTTYINEIIKLKLDVSSASAKEQDADTVNKPPQQQTVVLPLPLTTSSSNQNKLEKQDSGSSTNKDDANSETELAQTPTLPPVPGTNGLKADNSNLFTENGIKSDEGSTSAKPAAKTAALKLETKPSNFENLIINNNNAINANNNNITSNTTNQMGNKMSFINIASGAQLMNGKPQSITSNLSNFLVVRFELCSNQETTSKSKSKYKKSIKIISVSSKPLKYFESGQPCPDIQLKTFEFTEKCLSFRLACLDLNPPLITENRSDFDVKIINLYEKYLIALVNYRINEAESAYKLFRIKHEETTSSSSSNLQTDSKNSSQIVKEIIPNETLINPTEPVQLLTNQNCLTATSSSRLNLTEFLLCPTEPTVEVNMRCRVLSILTISVTTFDDDNDLKYIALLDEFGTISIVDPAKCLVVTEFKSPTENDKFVFMAYCYGIDKICAFTKANKIFFIPTHVNPIVNQSILDEVSGTINLNEISHMKELLVNMKFQSASLSSLHSLIYFEAVKTNFSAKLPSGWTPVISDQNLQRKHPQHIHGETNNYSKSWSCSSSETIPIDNFTVEIYLNKPIQIGCFQIKLKFNKELTSPFEIRLYKQKKQFEKHSAIKSCDNKIDFFNLNDKYELLFGPVDISEFLDLSCSKTYAITISSDKLLETRSNLFFLSLKPTGDAARSNSLGNSSTNLSHMLNKVSITIRKYRRTNLPHETIERGLMLQRTDFFGKLLEYVSETSNSEDLLNILDILNWIMFNHFSIDSRSLQSLIEVFKSHLKKFLLVFYLHGDRSTSRKATLLLNFFLNKNVDRNKSFGKILLENCLELLGLIPYFESSASMNWYFILIHRVMANEPKRTHDNCMRMLIALSKGHKYNPFYALLKMRYNFSCLIFESKLFDVDLYFKFNITNQKLLQQTQHQQANSNTLTNPYSFGSVGISLTGNNNLNGNHNNQNQFYTGSSGQNIGNSGSNNNANNLFQNSTDVFSSCLTTNCHGGNKELVNSFPQSVGLLEVLPLNFKFFSCSNGTQMEKGNQKQDTSLYVLPDFFSFFENQNYTEKKATDADSNQVSNSGQSPPIDFSIFNSIFNFQPLQNLIVERLEPVSRHFVVIDFGFPVAITDIMIPACSELSSLSIDYWTYKEQKDSRRLCVSTSVNQSAVLLNDLQPPIVCRYIKLIFVSLNANHVKAKIPIGYYFGYPYIFYNDNNNTVADLTLVNVFKQPNIAKTYLAHLEKLYEDNHCHYSMSVGKLRELINEIQFPSDNIGHLKMMQFNFNDNNDLSTRIKNVYKECLDYQFQLNLNAQLIKRMRSGYDRDISNERSKLLLDMKKETNLENLVTEMSQDKLRVANGLLIKTLLCLTYQLPEQSPLPPPSPANDLLLSRPQLNLEKACQLFRDLCVYGNFEKECSWLLLRCCYNEPWWGDFISACLKKFFVCKVKEVTPLSRAFITLNEICVKSLNGMQTNNLFKCLFALVDEILQPLVRVSEMEDEVLGSPAVEVTSLEWILLFISRLLSAIEKPKEATCRWEFLENIYSNYKLSSKQMSIRNKSKIKKKLFQSNKYFTWNKLKENRKNFEKYRKNFWKTDNLSQFNQDGVSANNSGSTKNSLFKKIFLPRQVSLSAGKSIVKLLVSANSFCSSDLFVLSCRIISSLCCNTQPQIMLNEIIERSDLNQLILLNISSEFNHGSVSWGSPWSQHAILSLFMDIIDSEKAMGEQSNVHSNGTDAHGSGNGELKLKTQDFLNAEHLKIIEENEEPQTIEKILEATCSASASVYDAIKLTSNLAKNFTQISDMLEVHLNDVDKKPFKVEEIESIETIDASGIDQKEIEQIEKMDEEKVKNDTDEKDTKKEEKPKINDEKLNDQEIEALVTNVVQAIKEKNESDEDQKDFDIQLGNEAYIKNMNLLEALSNLKNSSIYKVAAAAVSAASSQSQSFSKASFNNYLQTSKPFFNKYAQHINYLQSSIPLANVRGATDPHLMTNNVDFHNITISYDNRLDTNVYQTIENNLYVNMCIQNETMVKSLSEPLPAVVNAYGEAKGAELNMDADGANAEEAARTKANKMDTSDEPKSSIHLIQETLETLFEDLSRVNIENLLTFWLSLAVLDQEIEPNKFEFTNTSPVKQSYFHLNEATCQNLLEYLLNYSYMNVKIWHLTFRMLACLLTNAPSSLVNVFAHNQSLYKLIYKFISSNEELVGDECCHALLEFLGKFNKLAAANDLEKVFKKNLFQILCHAIDDSGCIKQFKGPLDSQVIFVEYLMGEDLLICYDDSDTTCTELNKEFEQMFVQYFNCLSKLVHHHICAYPRLSVKGQTSPRSCFSGFLTSLLFGSRSSSSSFSNGLSALNDKTKLSFENIASGQNFFGQNMNGSNSGLNIQYSNQLNSGLYLINNQNSKMSSHDVSSGAAGLSQLKTGSFSNTSKYSILCNRDNLICLLLKNGINLISNMKLNSKINSLIEYSSGNSSSGSSSSAFQKQQTSKQETIKPSTNYFSLPVNIPTDTAPNPPKPFPTSQSSQQVNGFYEDDLFLQQLYELQQFEIQQNDQQNDETESDFDFEQEPMEQASSTEKFFAENATTSEQVTKKLAPKSDQDLLKFITQQNTKKRQLIKILSNECLELFIESLGLCQSSALAMVISNSCYPIDLNLEDIQTPGDGLFLLLKSIAITPLKLVQSSFDYLNKIKRLSEPLLWFFSALFANEQVIRDFVQKGGIEIISKGLATTTRQLLYSGPCIISSLMNLIDAEKQQLKALNNNYDTESTEGFTNFASFGSIICTNPCGNPVDVLLQNTAPHRRIRSAIWSYHFQPNEHKIGLFITFPYTFLLKEIHILPHTVSIGNCPAYVSVEVSRDGSFMTPIGPPINTIGMLSIKLQLNKSELVNTVQINLYRSKDSQAVGLSQIRLLGYPIFENMLSAKPDMMLTPVEDLVSRSNMGWLRLLYMCLTSVPSIEQYVCENITEKTMLLCTRLLSSPAIIIYDKIIETILIKLSKYNRQRNLSVTRCLLRLENGLESGCLFSVPHGILIETLVNILFQITKIRYENDSTDPESLNLEKSRADLILIWLREQCSGPSTPSNMLLHCVACLIYKTADLPTTQDLPALVKLLLDYSLNLDEYYSKQAVDWVLCTLFQKRPQLIEILTDMMPISKLNELLNITTNQRTNFEEYSARKKHFVSLVETLSVGIQSADVIELFINSTFFNEVVALFQGLIDGRHDPSAQIFQLKFLRIFIAIADFDYGQNWLCNVDKGAKIWQGLIEFLCKTEPSLVKLNYTEEISGLVIKLLKKMLFCNQANQKKFAVYLTDLIKRIVCLDASASHPCLSGFLNQLILQVFLEDQTLTVNFQRKSTIFKIACNSSLGLLTHPRYGTGSGCRCVEVALFKSCTEMVNSISDIPIAQIISHEKFPKTTTTQQPKINNTENEMSDILANLKNYSESLIGLDKPKSAFSPKPAGSDNKLKLFLKVSPTREICLPNDMTLWNVLRLYLSQTSAQFVRDLTLTVQLTDGNGIQETAGDGIVSDTISTEDFEMLNSYAISSPLDEFVKCDGLITLAERLPILMPFIQEPLLNITEKDRNQISNENNSGSKTSPDFVDYVIMNESDEPFVDDIYNDMPVNTNTTSQTSKLKKITMPPYSFVAFGLFLKIPGYAKVMLKNRRQAQCILKLLLGANRNKEEEFGLSLSTMPFEALRDLLYDIKRSPEPELKIETCKFFSENHILVLIFSVLSSISHHPHRKVSPHFNQKIVSGINGGQSIQSGGGGGQQAFGITMEEQKNNLYWAKGTGFGTGSTIQHWDAEKTMMQQKMEEEHVTCIMEILSNFIECCSENTTDHLIEIFNDSCIINALSSYLRNDSVLDMSRHIPLYKSALKLVHSFVLQSKLRVLVQNCNIFDLVKNMKQFVDTYIQKIKLTEEDEGLASMLPILNSTYETVNSFLKPIAEAEIELNKTTNSDQDSEKTYCDIIKNHQFDSYSIVAENNNGTFKAVIPYFYDTSLNESTNFNSPNRAKRLAQETVTISNSLPLSYSSTVFARCDEERLDVMKVLITGPKDTPYANGCFEFDVFFPADYPDSPPLINLQTTGNQTVRFNPNLYHDGKVCLSILNTWHGRPEERWNGQTSSFLQVLVSIQSLILVQEPYFNEPGYERSRGTPAGTASSIEHDANIRQGTVKWAMLEILKKPPLCFKEAIRKHFYLKRQEIKDQCELWAKEMEMHVNDKQIGQCVSKSYIALKRHMIQLYEELDRLEEAENPSSSTEELTQEELTARKDE